MCYVRKGLLQWFETLELTVADKAALYRVERCMIYIHHIIENIQNIYTEHHNIQNIFKT